MHLNCAIIDDNSTDARYISGIVKHWSMVADHTVRINEFGSAEEFLFQYEDEKDYDILLLDIEMGGMNGVELAKKILKDNETVQIVFITGFPDFIAEGYEVSALHYLMKPVDTEKLCGVLDKAVCNLKYEKQLCVTFDRKTVFVPLRQILYIEAQKQYVQIYTVDTDYRMKESLSNVEKQVDEYILKCHRSFLVNLRYVAQIKSNCVVLKNGVEVPISRGIAEQIGKEIIRLFQGVLRMLFQKWIDKRIEAYQSDLMRKYCDEVESMYTKMRGWRHDYHNHIQAMQASMALGNYDEVNNYLCQLNDDLTNVDTTVKTGRVMVDAILNGKMNIALQNKIAVNAKAKIPLRTVKTVGLRQRF